MIFHFSEGPQNLISKGNDSVIYAKEGSVGLITLNRPDRYNSVNHDLVVGLTEAFNRIKQDRSVRSVVITGAGRGFCGGADMGDFGKGTAPSEAEDYIVQFYGTITRMIMALPIPVIAAINGSVAGVGIAFALACDLRVMGESSSIRYAFINIGLGPDGGAGWFLARAVGYSRAFEIAVEGEKIKANRCLELGLANKVVRDDEILTAAMQWAHTLAERPTFGVGITKQALNHAMTHTLAETTALEANNQKRALGSKDFVEGVSAFVEKRKPVFVGE